MLTQTQVISWLGGVGAAISIKLSSSIDDVVWLAPFLTSNTSCAQRWSNAVIYTTVCLCQTVIAMLIAYSGNQAVAYLTKDAKDAWSTEKILTVAAGSMLCVYSVKLTYEYFYGEDDDEGGGDEKKKEDEAEKGQYHPTATSEAQADSGNVTDPRPLSARLKAPLSMEVESAADPDKGEKGGSKKEKEGSQTLFVIAFIGSVDDLTLFVPMLVGKGFDIVQLVVGGLIAAVTIVLLCVFLGLCKPIADCLSKVPLAAIVIIFATVLLTKSYFMT